MKFRIWLIGCLLATVINPIQSQHKSAKAKPMPETAKLVVILHHPMNAIVRVKNIGRATAGPSKLTLDCVRLESESKMYSCPNLPILKLRTYFDAAFPNNATIQVPSLAPGETFTHTLEFWKDMSWPRGTYEFIAVADAEHNVAGITQQQNMARSMLIITGE